MYNHICSQICHNHASQLLRVLGIDASAARLYNESRAQVDRARGLEIPRRIVQLLPRVTVHA